MNMLGKLLDVGGMHMNNEYWLKLLKLRNGEGKNSRCLYTIDYTYMRLRETDTIINNQTL